MFFMSNQSIEKKDKQRKFGNRNTYPVQKENYDKNKSFNQSKIKYITENQYEKDYSNS